jgi:hypothetical protein
MSTCKKCDGTGLDACNECLGSGVKFCPKCKGYALIQKIAGGSFFCDICRGAGYIQECNGSDCDMGFKRCQCIKKVDVSSHEKQAIEELIAKANYLYSGGIDYFTTEALEPSSKIQPLKPKTKE